MDLPWPGTKPWVNSKFHVLKFAVHLGVGIARDTMIQYYHDIQVTIRYYHDIAILQYDEYCDTKYITICSKIFSC